MKETSAQSGGSPIDRKIRERAEKDARIIDEVLTASLTDCGRRVDASAKRWNAALDSTGAVMERRLRRMWLFPLAGILSGALLTLLTQWAGLWLAGDRLIWPRLEIQALNRAGLSVQDAPDGSRWILVPQGSAVTDGGRRKRTEEAMFILISGS